VASLLLRYYDPVRGRVTFDDQGESATCPLCAWLTSLTDIREFTTKSWRDVIGVVPQDPVLFTGTIASNIAYGNENVSRKEIETAALEANCEFVWGMPQGFDTPSETFHEAQMTRLTRSLFQSAG